MAPKPEFDVLPSAVGFVVSTVFIATIGMAISKIPDLLQRYLPQKPEKER